MDISDIKAKFKENGVDLKKDDAWQTQGTWVMKHKALERLAAALGIWFDDPRELIVDPEHVVIWGKGHVKVGSSGEVRSIWSYGEASMRERGSNYKVSGKMPAYIFAMAEKRLLDRIIIKLAGLHGAYSEDEADEFKDADKKVFPKDEDLSDAQPADAPAKNAAKPAAKPAEAKPLPAVGEKTEFVYDEAELAALSEEQRMVCYKVIAAEEIDQLMDLMASSEVQSLLGSSESGERAFMRSFANNRLKSLGWLAPKKGAKKAEAAEA